MTKSDIAIIRLMNQQIAGSKLKSPKEVCSWMAALQAQDFYMMKWAIGLRVPGTNEAEIDAALNASDLIRTHLLRPTWHVVSSDDVYWMLDLTAPQIKKVIKSYDKSVGMDESVHEKCRPLFEKMLLGQSLSREEMMLRLEAEGINTIGNRSAHLLIRAEMDGLICSGGTNGNQQTYALLEERVKRKESIHRDEALARLAERYFTSHGPASIGDFTWWSGLSASDAKKALESIKYKLQSETVENEVYWFASSWTSLDLTSDKVFILPSFDEYLISYKDRTASIAKELQPKAFSNNGIFWPIIVCEGRVIGIWKRTIKKDKVCIETEILDPDFVNNKSLDQAHFFGYGKFTNKIVEISKG